MWTGLEAKKKDDKKILEEYEIAYKDESKKLKASVKSSILFLERYRDLLKPHGKLLTIMDEPILNTKSNKPIRDWIKKNFIIKAVISLPQNTFVNAESGVKTSVLYLIKKIRPDEKQPSVFMAVSENIGHNDPGKPTPEKTTYHKSWKNLKDLRRNNGNLFYKGN
jgi:type I restriction enzyme M protein